MLRASGRALVARGGGCRRPDGCRARHPVPFSDTKLKNGLRVIISEDHTAPTVSVAVTYNVGSRRRADAAAPASRTSSST